MLYDKCLLAKILQSVIAKKCKNVVVSDLTDDCESVTLKNTQTGVLDTMPVRKLINQWR